jgi:hypothetical protein
VRLYKEPEPASDSAWLRFIEERRVPSRLVLVTSPSDLEAAESGGRFTV